METVEAFRQRARAWISANLEYTGPVSLTLRHKGTDEEELAAITREREVQHMMFDAGLAGVCFPREYGGQGLTGAHNEALNEELSGYEFPWRVQMPTLSPCGAVLLEFGTEDQKQRHIPAMLKGDEVWMQFLSEPSGGSDVAGALTTAVRDGDVWILNGSKVWTTGAWWSDWAICLVRTNWEVPKHRGLSVFLLPIHQPGIEVHRIEMINGNREFCQEFLTDVEVPDSDRIGEVDDGWTVGTRWMFYERMLYNSPLLTMPPGTIRGSVGAGSVIAAARETGRLDDPAVRDAVGEAQMLDVVGEELNRRIAKGIATGKMTDQISALSKMHHGIIGARLATAAFDLAGGVGAAWTDDDGELAHSAIDFLMRQSSSIAGGTIEMARNVISERVLGMPRDKTNDRDVAFRDVPRGRS